LQSDDAGRPPDSAEFAATRLGGGGGPGRSSVVAVLGFVALVGGLIGLGLAGRSVEESPTSSQLAALATPLSPRPSPRGTAVANQAPTVSRPSALPSPAPILTSEPGPVTIAARRHPETMYVHCDVFVERVTWVYVSLQDEAGRVAGWASVSVPGAAGPGGADGATLRFDVEVPIAEARRQARLWIQVIAYDADGQVVASSRVETPGDPGPDS
jgi:hypothetical protein